LETILASISKGFGLEGDKRVSPFMLNQISRLSKWLIIEVIFHQLILIFFFRNVPVMNTKLLHREYMKANPRTKETFGINAVRQPLTNVRSRLQALKLHNYSEIHVRLQIIS
jgi:hypothetical protein